MKKINNDKKKRILAIISAVLILAMIVTSFLASFAKY